jgi:exonuclease SbcC
VKPIRLELRSFGSYPGTEVVDFEALSKRGLFAVTGPTGSGKTMIFDAMVYALYGVLPGQRQGDGEARSHHAPSDAETSVTLDFEVDGARYRVHRQPMWQRPKKKGEGTTLQPAKATLVRLNGSATEPLATSASECGRRCRELVGLDALEFQRVVLLPQGEFNKVLLASDDDREKLLRDLFGGELYERAVTWLKEHVKGLEDEARQVDADLRHHRANAVVALAAASAAWKEEADPARIEGLDNDALVREVEELEAARAGRRQALDAVRRKALEVTQRKSVADEAARRFDDAEAARRSLAALDAQREDVAAARAEAEASRRARPVARLGEHAEGAEQRAVVARRQRAETEHAVTAGLVALGTSLPLVDPARVAAAVQDVTQRVEAEQRALADVEAADRKLERSSGELTAAKAVHEGLVASAGAIRTELASLASKIAELQPLAAVLPERRAAFERATRRIDTRSRLAEAAAQLEGAEAREARARGAYERTMARFVETQAPRLAAGLEAGVPCPVCGSTEHPSPARASDGKPVDHEEVDRARQAWSKATAATEQARASVGALRSELGDEADLGIIEVFGAALEVARGRLEEAERASEDLAVARRAVVERGQALSEATERERRKAQGVAALEERVRGERAALEAATERARGIDPKAVEERTSGVRALKLASAGYGEAYDLSNRAESEHEALGAQLLEALVSQGYAALEDARRLLTSEESERQALERFRAWESGVAEQGTRLRQLQEQGVPEARPDVEALAGDLARAAARANEAERTFTTASNAVDAARAAMQALLERTSQTAGLRDRLDTARLVFKTCNGEAGIKVKLDRWVLGGELDRVTRAANVYLARMTTSRYRLERVKGNRGGLSLEAFDAHTGRARSPASLSGGEQFQASLALALGLADVVSQGGLASGKRFEALFVDEGFGSLDPDTLDEAIYALSMLQATGRVVGAITHVEAMKERLHVGIEVRRLGDGKGSTLVVNP